MRRLVEISLRLPAGWFEVPLQGDEGDLVEWASGVAHAAWRVRADAGVPEDAVFPDAGRNVVIELTSLALNLREQLAGAAPGLVEAHAWVPLPEMGIVSAVVIGQIAERSPERSPERFAATLEALSDAESSGALHRERLEGDLGGDPLRGLHSMVGHLDPESGVAALEERTCFGFFPAGCAEMAEILFIAERPAAFEDMPTETYALLDGLELAVAEAV